MSPTYDEGYRAYLDGKQKSDNPYWWCTAKKQKWDEGWSEAHQDALNEKAALKAGDLE